MSEAITAEQALATARMMANICYNLGQNGDVDVDTRELLMAMAEAWDRDFPALRNALPRWIPVEERLPEEDHCHVLMAADSGLVCSTFYSVIGHEAKHYTDNVSALFEHAATFCYRVTHWMPLPAPPTQEEQE